MVESANAKDEQRFNETLKRMLKTPPKPHDAKSTDAVNDKDDTVQDDSGKR